MKSFFQFLESTAVQQATRMGLTSDGHGGWYDKKGEFVAKTEKGSLKFFNKRQRVGQDPPSSEKEKSLSGMQPAGAQQPTQEPVAKLPEAPPEVEKTKGTLTVAFGRFNPPTTGHQKLLQRAKSEASRKNFALKIYPSRTQDKKKNPLEPGTKIEYMKKMFDDVAEDIIDDPEAKTIFDVMVAANELGFSRLTIMVGQDRLSEFQSLAHKYNGDLYEFEEIEVVSAGTRDADSEGLEGMSASKMRKAAADGDFKAFVKGIPNLGNMEKKDLFNNLRKSMGSEAKSESYVWEIAPKLDEYNLRESYRRGDLFPIGALVENLNTGEIGRVTRRGTNHVICMTPEGTMFKSWLRDLAEAYEIGTDDYREYVQAMSAGQPVRKFGEPKKRIKPTILPLKPNDPKKHK